MEDVMAGEPAKDLADFHYYSEGREPDFSSLQRGYGEPAFFGEDFMKRLYLYQHLYTFPKLAYFQRRGDPSMVATVQRRLPLIEAQLDAL